MRILVLCPHFEPDVAPTGVVMTEIAHHLVDQGHELDIVTALPWYRGHTVEDGWTGQPWRRQRTEWGSVLRVHPFPTDKTNIVGRALGFAGFTTLVAIGAVFRRRRPDVVLTMSPPLLLGLAGWLAARLRRVPLVFNVQDVFPDVAIEVGAIRNRRVIAGLSWLERFVYRRADAVTVLSSDLMGNVSAKIGRQDPKKIRVIANFVDTERIKPADRATRYREEIEAGDRTVVMYAGNMGFSQPLDLMVETARRWHNQRDVLFVLNGGGSERSRLEAAAAGLSNICFVDYQPIERVPEVLASADIHVIALKHGLARSSVPSKLYSILAAGRPALAAIDPGTEVATLLEKHDCGVSCAPEDLDLFEDALQELVADPLRCAAMGERGRTFVEAWVSPAAVAEAYGRLFTELTEF